MAELYLGLMSGTSLDGVDGVLIDFSGTSLSVLAHVSSPLPAELGAELLALNTSGLDELHRAALAANALVRVYATVVQALLARSQTDARQVLAIGAHGQTVRHQPGSFDGTGYTLQLNNPALLAELCHIDVVADFRSRDVAAGGQGAPLVPAFHQSIFGGSGVPTAVLNLGGMANLTVLGAQSDDEVLGFDCGPGNVLMDAWCLHHRGESYDHDGAWARSGQVHQDLLAVLRAEPFFKLAPPKSTGRDLFNTAWLSAALARFPEIRPADVQATLAELTSLSCTDAMLNWGVESRELLVCGGGAFNTYLMTRLQAALPGVTVMDSQARGLPPLQVEAAAFAWLARQTLNRSPGNLRRVTGAAGARVLGAIYPA